MKIYLIVLGVLFVASCNRTPQPVANSSNSNLPERPMRSQTAIAHTTENATPKPANSNGGGKWSSNGDPIDMTKFDEKIAAAEKDLKAKPNDGDAKNALAEAYFERGVALTEARQYAAALGDYRRALKYQPDHKESKTWIDQIVSIYQMLKKEAPKEGEEPPPLPFKRTA